MIKTTVIVILIALALLFGSLFLQHVGALSDPGVTTWSGNERVVNLGYVVHAPQVVIDWSTGDTMANVYCGVTSGPHFPPQPSDQFAWVGVFGGAAPPNHVFPVFADCQYILVASYGQPVVFDVSAVPESMPPPRR